VKANKDNIKSTATEDGLLQANATVIAGVLIFLTIASFAVGLPEITSRLYVILFTSLIIFPFAISSYEIIRKGTITRRAKRLSELGFMYLLAVIGFMGVVSYIGSENPSYFFSKSTLTSIAEQCALDPKKYNITHLSACSKFTTGSLAEECAFAPQSFHLELAKCSEFIS
jgi:hypothetical protein